jgi:hypothetical protein
LVDVELYMCTLTVRILLIIEDNLFV